MTDREVQSRLLDFYHQRYGYGKIIDLAGISDGWENEVYSFTLESGESKREELILRIYPGKDAPRKAAKEFSGMRKLHKLGFPVPEVLILELDDFPFGKPFVIMEKIQGRSMADVFDESTNERRQELIAEFCGMFVELHSLDWRPFAPDPSIYETGEPYVFIQRLFMEVQEYIDRFQKWEFAPVVDWLKERSFSVPCERLSVIHLDYHPHNILMRDDGKAFVIDWTNIGVADFRLDLAWTLLLIGSYGSREHRDTILAGYEQAAGQEVQQIEYFEVVASVRRLLSILVSLSHGADSLGMRPEALEMMRQSVDHIRNVYSLLHERTGIKVPEIESVISDLS